MVLEDYLTIVKKHEEDIGVAKLRAEPVLGRQLDEVCEAICEHPLVSLTLDFGSVDYVSDQSGSCLLRLLQSLREVGHSLQLTNVSKPTHDILTSMGLADLVPIADDDLS